MHSCVLDDKREKAYVISCFYCNILATCSVCNLQLNAETNYFLKLLASVHVTRQFSRAFQYKIRMQMQVKYCQFSSSVISRIYTLYTLRKACARKEQRSLWWVPLSQHFVCVLSPDIVKSLEVVEIRFACWISTFPKFLQKYFWYAAFSSQQETTNIRNNYNTFKWESYSSFSRIEQWLQAITLTAFGEWCSLFTKTHNCHCNKQPLLLPLYILIPTGYGTESHSNLFRQLFKRLLYNM